MIKIFRKIRKNLLNQGKTTRYFKYAIGEILLVVIGILIALQINNWNTQNRIHAEGRATLANLLDDLKSDQKRFNEIINIYTEQGIQLTKEKDLIFKKSLTDEEIKITMKFSGVHIQNLNPQTTTYDEMLNTGRIYSLSNQLIVNDINNYYQLIKDSIYENTEGRREFRALLYGPDLTEFWFWRGYEHPFEHAKMFFQNDDIKSHHLLMQTAGWSLFINFDRKKNVEKLLLKNTALQAYISKELNKDNHD